MFLRVRCVSRGPGNPPKISTPEKIINTDKICELYTSEHVYGTMHFVSLSGNGSAFEVDADSYSRILVAVKPQ